MLVFREEKSADEEAKAWQFWHGRQHSAKQRILDAGNFRSLFISTSAFNVPHFLALPLAHPPSTLCWKLLNLLNCDRFALPGTRGIPRMELICKWGWPTWNWIGVTASSCSRFLASPANFRQMRNMNFVEKIYRYVLLVLVNVGFITFHSIYSVENVRFKSKCLSMASFDSTDRHSFWNHSHKTQTQTQTKWFTQPIQISPSMKLRSSATTLTQSETSVWWFNINYLYQFNMNFVENNADHPPVNSVIQLQHSIE